MRPDRWTVRYSGASLWSCVYQIFDSAWTQRTEGVSSSPNEGSIQADSRRTGFALQVESKAGSRNPDPTATDQCASPAGTETTAPQQYRSVSVCLALSLVPLCPWGRSAVRAVAFCLRQALCKRRRQNPSMERPGIPVPPLNGCSGRTALH